MQSTGINRSLLKKIVLRSLRFPVVYLIIGIIFLALAYVDLFLQLTQWKNLFDITDKLGNIFIALALITFIYNLFVFICLRYEQKLTHFHKVTALILSNIRKGSRIIFLLIVLNMIIIIASPTRSYLMYADSIIKSIIIASIGWILIQILYTIEVVIYQYMLTLTSEEHIRVKALYTKMRIARNIGTVVIVFITIAAILMSFNSVKNIGISLLASAGFLTAIVGLSAQKTLFSIFSGIQLALSQPIKIGDVVVVEKEVGIVEEITFTYITLKLGDRRRLVVPINYFIDKPFENWSRDMDSMRSSLHFNVDFMMPVEPLRKQLDNILQQSPYWDGNARKLQVANLNSHGVEIRIQVSASNADNLADIRAEVREKMLEFMQNNYPDYFPNSRVLSATTLKGSNEE